MSLVVELKSDSRDSRLTVLERQEDRWSILESDDDGGGGLDSRIILSATEGQELLLFLDGRVNFGAPELSKLTGVDMILEVYENNPLARVEMTNVFELVRSATLADTRSYARRENMIADVENPAQSTFQLNIKNDIGESACLIIDVQTTGDTTATLSSANGIELSYNDDGVGLGSRILWPIFQTSGDTEEVYVLEIKPWNQTSDFDLLVEVAPLDVCRDFDEYRRPIGEEMADAVRNDRVLGLADGPTR
ncbi:MAG: hypothetical protein MRY72_14190 [Aquisalinus sp.]|nr:hypothetical protein [Aquisalinus sp.]